MTNAALIADRVLAAPNRPIHKIVLEGTKKDLRTRLGITMAPYLQGLFAKAGFDAGNFHAFFNKELSTLHPNPSPGRIKVGEKGRSRVAVIWVEEHKLIEFHLEPPPGLMVDDFYEGLTAAVEGKTGKRPALRVVPSLPVPPALPTQPIIAIKAPPVTEPLVVAPPQPSVVQHPLETRSDPPPKPVHQPSRRTAMPRTKTHAPKSQGDWWEKHYRRRERINQLVESEIKRIEARLAWLDQVLRELL